MTKLQAIEHMIEELPIRQKITLVKKLEKETAQNRISSILKHIDERGKNNPISEKEITAEVKAVRKKLYAKYYH